MEIKNKIYETLKSKTKVQFDDNTKIEDLGIDSLDLIELITMAETALSVEISDSTLLELVSVNDIVLAFQNVSKK